MSGITDGRIKKKSNCIFKKLFHPAHMISDSRLYSLSMSGLRFFYISSRSHSRYLLYPEHSSLGSNPATAISPPDCFRSQSNKSRGRPRTKDHVVVLVQYADGEAVQGPCCGPYTAASPALYSKIQPSLL